MQRLLPVVLACRTCDLHHIAVIHSLTMKIYRLQAAAPRLDFGNRPVAVLRIRKSSRSTFAFCRAARSAE